MNFLELRYNDNVYTREDKILEILQSEKFYWLIDSLTSDAVIEIKNNTLIWHDGIFSSGDWKYGIFKNGGFYADWENGIWENGYFDSKVYKLTEINQNVFTLTPI